MFGNWLRLCGHHNAGKCNLYDYAKLLYRGYRFGYLNDIRRASPLYYKLELTFPAQTGTTANNLASGFYSFLVTDANGCTRSGTVNIPPVNTVALNVTGSNATCTLSNGSINLTPSGGNSSLYLPMEYRSHYSIAERPLRPVFIR